MANKNYVKGYRLERNIVNLARDNNLIAFRSAGSKSGSKIPIDVTIIDPKLKRIIFIQAKNKKSSQKAPKCVREAFSKLSDIYSASFIYISSLAEIKQYLGVK